MRRLPSALLALSLALNAALLLRGGARSPPGEVLPGTHPAGASPPVATLPARPLDAIPGQAGSPGSARGAPTTPPGPEAARVAALQAEVAALRVEASRLERELSQALPLRERFERGTGGPEAEARIRPDVEHALAAADARAWSIACRGSICRLEVLSLDKDMFWMQPFQADAGLRRWVRGAQFGAGTPRTDPVSGEMYLENQVHLDVRDEPDVLSPELLRLVQAFRGSSSLADCTGGFAEKGSWQARVDLGAQGIAVSAAGSLSTRAAGRCLEERLRAALAPLASSTPAGCADCGAVAFVELVSPPPP